MIYEISDNTAPQKSDLSDQKDEFYFVAEYAS